MFVLTVGFSAVWGQLGLVLHPWAFGGVLHQQEGLLRLALAHDALLVLRLPDALQVQVTPAAQDQGAQGGDGDEGDDDRNHPGGGAVVHGRGHAGAVMFLWDPRDLTGLLGYFL